MQVAASISRGNQCRFCTFWHVNIARLNGISLMSYAWLEETLTALDGCMNRCKAMALWFRDANSSKFVNSYQVCLRLC